MLRFLDPDSLREVDQIQVQDGDIPIAKLNELEYIRGAIWANERQTDQVVRIDPQPGRVNGWIELGELLSPEDRIQPVGVLNGIAYDPRDDRVFVTGKEWPKLFEIEVLAPGQGALQVAAGSAATNKP